MQKALSVFLLFCLLVPVGAIAQETYTVSRAQREVVVTGYTRADSTTVLSSEVPGRVSAVNYDVGDSIGKKPFVAIDHTFIEFSIQNTKAAIAKLDAAAEKNRSLIQYLEKEFNRVETLYKSDRAPEIKRDAAAQELAQAKLDAKTIASERGTLDVTLQELTERRRRHDVTAGPGWTVVARMVEPGENVAAGQPLGKVADFSRLTVPLCITDGELSAMEALGPLFDAKLDGKTVKASINWINPEFDERTRKRCIEVAVSKYPGEHRGGLKFSLALSVQAEGLLVDKRAVAERYENPRVTLADGKKLNVLVLSDSGPNVILADDGKLKPGTKLLPAAGK
ncbi:MAG: HlyD family efflux transporter periplasmic adaptor subunit [Thermodesulfobacteriota bacterium]